MNRKEPALQLHAHARQRGTGELHAVRGFVGHHPKLIDSAGREYDILLSGQLHRGQLVTWKTGERLHPGAWFSRW